MTLAALVRYLVDSGNSSLYGLQAIHISTSLHSKHTVDDVIRHFLPLKPCGDFSVPVRLPAALRYSQLKVLPTSRHCRATQTFIIFKLKACLYLRRMSIKLCHPLSKDRLLLTIITKHNQPTYKSTQLINPTNPQVKTKTKPSKCAYQSSSWPSSLPWLQQAHWPTRMPTRA